MSNRPHQRVQYRLCDSGFNFNSFLSQFNASQLEMEDDDTIEVFQQQTGGHQL